MTAPLSVVSDFNIYFLFENIYFLYENFIFYPRILFLILGLIITFLKTPKVFHQIDPQITSPRPACSNNHFESDPGSNDFFLKSLADSLVAPCP